MGDLEIDTRLEPRGDSPHGARFRVGLSRDWEIWGPNGGYLAAIALRAAGAVARVPRPASLHGHFLSVAGFDAPLDVEVRVVRAGRRSESLAVALSQGGKPVFEGLVRSAAEGPGLRHQAVDLPERVGPLDRSPIQELVDEEGPPYAFWSNFEVRPVWPERFAAPRGTPYEPCFREWVRFLPRATFDDPWLDAARALILVDTYGWIAACQPHPDAGFRAPNLDLTVWFHEPDPGCAWLLADHLSPVAAGGLVSAHGRVWSEQGRLLATGGAQLFCMPATPA